MGKTRWYYRDFQEGKQGIRRRWVWGGLMWVVKIKILDGGRHEMVVNRCFEDLEGGVGLERGWEVV